MFLLAALFTVPAFFNCVTAFNLTEEQYYKFIDKTLAMKVVIEKAHEPLILTAPSGFGKTWSLKMLESFLSTNSDEELVKEMFKDTLILQDANFMKANFRSYPVIYISFKHNTDILNITLMVEDFQENLRRLFLDHDYLLTSPYLSHGDLEEYKKHTRNSGKDFGPNGLYILSRLLAAHYRKKVALLIDDFDSNIIDSIFNEDLDINEVVRFYSTVLSTSAVYNPNVKLCVITGISCAALSPFAELGVAPRCVKFLHQKPFELLFGLSEPQVHALFAKARFAKFAKQLSDVRMWYNGFTGPDETARAYNTRSVLAFLGSGQLRMFWNVSKERPALRLLTHDIVSKSLFAADNQTVRVDLCENSSLEELTRLKNMMARISWDTALAGLYVALLVDLGYFTFDSTDADGSASVRLPNLQICEAVKAVVLEAAREAGSQRAMSV